MTKRSFLAALIGCLALVGCDKGESESSSGSGASEASAGDSKDGKGKFKAMKEVAKSSAEAGSVAGEGLAEAAGGKKNYEFSIDGVDLPTVSGSLVMAQSIGPRLMYKMGGAGAMHTVTLNDVEKHAVGTFDVYSVQLLWTDDQYACRKAKDGKLQLVVKKEGDKIRGELEGDVLCRPVKDDSAEDEKATVKGWFVD